MNPEAKIEYVLLAMFVSLLVLVGASVIGTGVHYWQARDSPTATTRH